MGVWTLPHGLTLLERSVLCSKPTDCVVVPSCRQDLAAPPRLAYRTRIANPLLTHPVSDQLANTGRRRTTCPGTPTAIDPSRSDGSPTSSTYRNVRMPGAHITCVSQVTACSTGMDTITASHSLGDGLQSFHVSESCVSAAADVPYLPT